MTDWTEKYRPSSLSKLRGNDKARDALKKWAETWDDHREAAILHGSPGVGKTSAAHALASDMGWSTIEMNASDTRTADVVDQIAGEAAKSGTLTQQKQGEIEKRLVVMDEADNLHGNVDRGGSRAITDVVKEANQPVVLIANEYYDMGKGLRNATREIEFRDVGKRSIAPVLRDICRNEGVDFEDEAIEQLAEKNSGDLRSAIKDLQAVVEGSETFTTDDLVTGERDSTVDLFDFLEDVLQKADPETALRQSYDVDETPDDLVKWVEDNMPKDYDREERPVAYEFLANADRWLGRVRATQDYSYWRYVTDNLAAGVAAARNGTKSGWTPYNRPQMWIPSDSTRDYVARKIAEAEGVSMSTARREIVPFLAAMTHHCKNRELTVAMTAKYDLDAEHVSFVTGSGETTNKVEGIVEDAKERKEEDVVAHAGSAFEGAVRDSSAESDASASDSAEGSDGTDSTETADSSGSDASEDDDDAQSGLTDFA